MKNCKPTFAHPVHCPDTVNLIHKDQLHLREWEIRKTCCTYWVDIHKSERESRTQSIWGKISGAVENWLVDVSATCFPHTVIRPPLRDFILLQCQKFCPDKMEEGDTFLTYPGNKMIFQKQHCDFSKAGKTVMGNANWNCIGSIRKNCLILRK